MGGMDAVQQQQPLIRCLTSRGVVVAVSMAGSDVEQLAGLF
jgi:hypothetical protein